MLQKPTQSALVTARGTHSMAGGCTVSRETLPTIAGGCTVTLEPCPSGSPALLARSPDRLAIRPACFFTIIPSLTG
ncbi:hypothetical protein PGT21_002364 [Puccinia graminis f. sp. tritici]|uniref:Uncharacterized protein n=1 Tax=Puccinia graminis f. sp. tritici TaxID=56615 RepID=A0A5B0NPL3_PUCGR|nr:hypothetical protein PGTUg99_033738 [Puccinia graminis f. sp. tritici]KAA1090474.1 hypothetical protein PGT21_002364 [Puccinia graminis f. sp. tritici]